MELSFPKNKHILELNKSNKSPTIKSRSQSFGHGTSSYFLCRGLKFHKLLGEIHQAHSTHLTSIQQLHSNPFSTFSLPKRLYALIQPVSDKPSHIQVGMETYLWESCMMSDRPKEHNQASFDHSVLLEFIIFDKIYLISLFDTLT